MQKFSGTPEKTLFTKSSPAPTSHPNIIEAADGIRGKLRL
jgi:hypothetical protein